MALRNRELDLASLLREQGFQENIPDAGGRRISAQPFPCWEPGVTAAGAGSAAHCPLGGTARQGRSRCVRAVPGFRAEWRVPLSVGHSGTCDRQKASHELFVSSRKRALKRTLFPSFP